jgi:ARP2/3 complex 20 kDa subunit (ARPC4)
MLKHKIVDFIIQCVISFCVSIVFVYLVSRFMEEVDKEISEMKLSLNARARTVAESYLTAVRRTNYSVFETHSCQSLVQFMNIYSQVLRGNLNCCVYNKTNLLPLVSTMSRRVLQTSAIFFVSPGRL